MNVALGMNTPQFGDIARSLNVILSNQALQNFSPSKNGLGMNNILYISMLLEYFHRRISEAKTAGQVLLIEDLIDQNSKIKLLESIDQMIVGIHKNVPDPNNLKIDSLGLFANPKKCLHLMTLHGAKGREFEAVALIDLHDGRLPHFSSDESGVDEAKRVLYVGITRPRKVLMLFTDNSDYRNKPSRFLRNFN